MPPGMCIYRMKPEICSLLLKRTPHCTCYLSRASNIWQLCVIVYQYYRDPLCGEQWGQRSRCENAPIYGIVGAQEPRWQQQHWGCWLALPRAITIIRLPMYTNTVARVYMYVLPIIIITVSQNYTKRVLGRDPKIILPWRVSLHAQFNTRLLPEYIFWLRKVLTILLSSEGIQ